MVDTPPIVRMASSNKPDAKAALVSTALVTLRFSVTFTTPEAPVRENSGLLALVEPDLRAMVAPVAVTLPGRYSIPVARFTFNSPTV